MGIEKAEEILNTLKKIVEKQALDEGLWFQPKYISEDYLQKTIRKLHAIIEDDETMLKALEDKDGD